MYNDNIMKNETIHIRLERKNRRAIELYANNSPFKPKVVDNRKSLYKRKAKHPKQMFGLD